MDRSHMSTLAREWSGTRTPKTSRCRSPAVRLVLEEDGHAPFQLPLAGTTHKARHLRAERGYTGKDPLED